jgi:mycofactocin system glycosyltransferase
MTTGLPEGFTVRLGRRVRVLDGGRVLIGGSPTTALSLAPRAATSLRQRQLTVTDAATGVLASRLLDLGMAGPVPDLLPPCREPITVVVPVRDRPEQLRRLLASIEGAHRVVVVDDASSCPEAIEAVSVEAGAELVRLERNVGPAAARNAGLAEVRTPLVAFVDSDVELTPNALPQLARCFADPAVGLVAPWVRGRLPSSGGSWMARYDADRSSLDLGADAGTVRPRAPVAWLPAACLVARTDALGPGFSPELRVGEDVDLVWRLVSEGRRVLYVASVQVFHEARATAWDVLHRKLVYGTSVGDLARRHGSAVAPAVLAPWSVAAVVALVSQRRWSVPLCGLVTGLAAERIRRRLPRAPQRTAVAAELAVQGLLAALSQAAALGLRHWWPLGALLGSRSSALRRFLVVAAVLEGVTERRRCQSDLALPCFLVARRLDDMAYGTGAWIGTLRARAWTALLPDVQWTGRHVAGRREGGLRRLVRGPLSSPSAVREHEDDIAEKR